MINPSFWTCSRIYALNVQVNETFLNIDSRFVALHGVNHRFSDPWLCPRAAGGLRVFEHKNDFVDGFTKTYKVHTLVYYETHEDIKAAIAREKQIKNWRRAYKINAITAFNPTWDDLYDSLFG
jgi:putative endonuclease